MFTKLEEVDEDYVRVEALPDEHLEYVDYVSKHADPAGNDGLGHKVMTLRGVYGVLIPGANIRRIFRGSNRAAKLTKSYGDSHEGMQLGDDQLESNQRDLAAEFLPEGGSAGAAKVAAPDRSEASQKSGMGSAPVPSPSNSPDAPAAKTHVKARAKGSAKAKGKAKAAGGAKRRGRPPKDLTEKVAGAIAGFLETTVGDKKSKYIGDGFKTHRRCLADLKTDLESSLDDADLKPIELETQTADDLAEHKEKFDKLVLALKQISVVVELCKGYKEHPESVFVQIMDQQMHHLAMAPVIDVKLIIPRSFLQLRHKRNVWMRMFQVFGTC